MKGLLLQCATPEAVCRLSDSKLKQEAEMLCKHYMEEQQHSSLADYLRQQIRRETARPGGDEGPQREIVYQVSLDVFLVFLIILNFIDCKSFPILHYAVLLATRLADCL